jgi:hypothetical protein
MLTNPSGRSRDAAESGTTSQRTIRSMAAMIADMATT